MQILSRTVNFDGTEQSNVIIAVNCKNVVFTIENRGPATIHINGVCKLDPGRFVVLGEFDEIALEPPAQFATVDVLAYLKP